MFHSTAQREAVENAVESMRGRIRALHALLVAPTATTWIVKGGELPRVRRFATKELAIGFARDWAEQHRPSVVRLEIVPGDVAGEWEYGDPGSA
jgi:hypothetical protein